MIDELLQDKDEIDADDIIKKVRGIMFENKTEKLFTEFLEKRLKNENDRQMEL